jgi:hypothetical protein
MADQNKLLVLCHFDGSNGSTNVVNDAEPISGIGVSEVISGEISTNKSKFGVSSFKNYGSDNSAKVVFDTTNCTLDFIQGEFTFDAWVYVPSGEASWEWEVDPINLYLSVGGVYVSVNFYIYYESPNFIINNYLYNRKDDINYLLHENIDINVPNISVNAWHHLALVKSSDQYVRSYLDGVLIWTSSNQWPFLYLANGGPSIETYAYGNVETYLDEVRYTKEALWTGNSFDPPTKQMDFDTPISESLISFSSYSSLESGDFLIESPIDFPIQTVLLLQGDGANNSTVIKDTSIEAQSISRYGSACISTAQYKFPTGSIYFPTSSSYLNCAYESSIFAFGNDPFTIDFWFNPSTLPSSNATMYWQSWNHYAYSLSIMLYNVSGSYKIVVNMTYSGGSVSASSSDFPSLTTGSWHHVAVVYKDANLYVGVDGVVTKNSWTSSNNITSSTINVQPYYIIVYIDSLRVVKGIAVWTKNFDVPTKRYSDVIQGQYDYKDFSSKTAFCIDSEYNQNKVTFSQIPLLMHFDGNTKNEITGLSFPFNAYPSYPNAQDWVFGKVLYVSSSRKLILSNIDCGFGTSDFSIDFFLEAGCSTTDPIFEQTDISGDYYRFYATNTNPTYTLIFEVSIGGVVKRCSFVVNNLYSPSRRHYAVARYNNITCLFLYGDIMATMTDTYSIPSFSNPLTFYPSSYIDELRIVKGASAYKNSPFFVTSSPYHYEREPIIINFPIDYFLSTSDLDRIEFYLQVFQLADFVLNESWALYFKNLGKPANLYNTILFLDGEGTTGNNPEDKSIWKFPLLYNSPVSKISDTRSKFGSKSIYVKWNDEFFRTQAGLLRKYLNLFDFRRNDFTIDFWHYYVFQEEDTYQDESYLVRFMDDADYSYFEVAPGMIGQPYSVKYPGNCLRIFFRDPSNSQITTTFQTIEQTYNNFILNNWVHFAITRHNDVFRIFINGEKVLEQYFVYDFPTPTGSCFFTFFHRMFGYIDNYRVINGISLWEEEFDPNYIFYDNISLLGQAIFSSQSDFDLICNILKYEIGVLGTYSEFDIKWANCFNINDFDSFVSFIFRSKYLKQWFFINGFKLENFVLLKNVLQELVKSTDVFDIKTSIQFYQKTKSNFVLSNSYIQSISDEFTFNNKFTEKTKSDFTYLNSVGHGIISGEFLVKNSIGPLQQTFVDSFVFDDTYLGV